MKKIGVLGGTFDPIHLGHLGAGDAAQGTLSLDAVLLIPSRVPPHRTDQTRASAEDRFKMAELAARERPGWMASRIEIEREGPSYTYDTLAELAKTGSEYFFITGADAFAEIETWSRYPAVLDLANFVVVTRPGFTLDSLRERARSAFNRPASAHTRVILIEAHTPDVSSTDIRRRAAAGQSLSGLVPDSVADYITTHRLYSRS